MDLSLIILGAVIALSLASATVWHLIVKSYAWAVAGSSLTTGLVTYWGYPLYRGVGHCAWRRNSIQASAYWQGQDEQ